MALNSHTKPESPVWQIVEHIQRNGAATIKDLEDVLGITTTAVRQHLSWLISEGYTRRQTVHAGVGRPYHAYALTDKARELFACRCDDLALTLLEEVFVLEGSERALLLLDRVGDKLATQYVAAIRANTLQERAKQFANALQSRGVLTDIALVEGDEIMLKLYNCPFHELAQARREICDMDAEMISKVVGAPVQSTACLMDGHNSCSFVIANGMEANSIKANGMTNSLSQGAQNGVQNGMLQ
jgi:predicted ArsR family transcriptional regulator